MFGNLKAAATNAIIKQGDSGEAVKVLQKILTQAGQDPGEADGIFGSKTKDALKAIQAKLGVDADGVYGPASAKAIMDFVSQKGGEGAMGKMASMAKKMTK